MKTCVMEKTVAVSRREFENLKNNPLRDNDLIAENAGLMYCDSNEEYHCLLIYDKEQGDGLLIESEGANMHDMPNMFLMPNFCMKIMFSRICRK